MSEERRQSDVPLGDTARILAIMYIFGYIVMVAAMFKWAIPDANREIVISLVSIMSTVQVGIIGFYFGGSKAAEVGQRNTAAAKEKADTTLQELAKTAPATAALAVAASRSEPVPPQRAPISADTMQVDAGTVNVQGATNVAPPGEKSP